MPCEGGGGLFAMKRITVLIGIVSLIHFGCAKSNGPANPPSVAPSKSGTPLPGAAAPLSEPAPLVAGAMASTGLSPEEREDFYHTPEGSALFPLDWLRALHDKDTSRP